MPHGEIGAISPVVQIVLTQVSREKDHDVGGIHGEERGNPPWTAIDLGVGYGIMGTILRGMSPTLKIYGIEGLAAYRIMYGRPLEKRIDHPVDDSYVVMSGPSVWDAVYEGVTVADFTEEVPRLIEEGEHYDVGIFTEALEHLSDEDGEALLPLLPKLARNWVLSTPDRHFTTPGGAPYQQHISLWPPERLREFGWTILGPPNSPTYQDEGAWPMTLAHLGDWPVGEVTCVRVVEP